MSSRSSSWVRLTAFLVAQLFLFFSVSPSIAFLDSPNSHLRTPPLRASDGGTHFLLEELSGEPLQEAESLAAQLKSDDLDVRFSELAALLRTNGGLKSDPKTWIPILTYALSPKLKAVSLYTEVQKSQEELFAQCNSCGVSLINQGHLFGALATAIDAVHQEGLIRTHPTTNEVMHSAYALSRLMDGYVEKVNPTSNELDRLAVLLKGENFFMAHVRDQDPSGDHFIQVKEIGHHMMTILDRNTEQKIRREDFLRKWTGVLLSPHLALRDSEFRLSDAEAKTVFGCCGIVGYVRLDPERNEPVNLWPITPLINEAAMGVEQRAGRHGQGVTTFEYRPSGLIAMSTRKVTEGAEALGKVLKDNPLPENAFTFLFHGRWPTQGGNTIPNTHPHRVGSVVLAENGDATNNAKELLPFLEGKIPLRGEEVGSVELTNTFLRLLPTHTYLMMFVAEQLGIQLNRYVKNQESPEKDEIEELHKVVSQQLEMNKNELSLKIRRPSNVETDAWTLSALVNHFYIRGLLEEKDTKMAMLHALRKMNQVAEGYYSIWVVNADEPSKVYGLAIEDQPMVIGIGGKGVGNFLTSDPIAFLAQTNEAAFLQHGDYAVVAHNGYEIFQIPESETFNKRFPLEIDKAAPISPKEVSFIPVPKEERPIYQLNKEEFEITKKYKGNPYDYYTLKEIYQQPETFKNTIKFEGRLDVLRRRARGEKAELQGVHLSDEAIQKLKQVIFIASGTASFASLMGQSKFFKAAALEVKVTDGQEFVEMVQDYAVDFLYAMAKREKSPLTQEEISRRIPVAQPRKIAKAIENFGIKIPGIDPDETLGIAVTQSGNTKDTLGALTVLKALGVKIITIVNKPGLSPIAQAAVEKKVDSDGKPERIVRVIRTKAGLEKGVASTKATTSQVGVIQEVGQYFGLVRGTYDPALALEYLENFETLPEKMEEMLRNPELHKALKEVAQNLLTKQSVNVMGRGGKDRFLGWAKEQSLKPEELAYITFKPLHLSGMKHGPIATYPEDYDIKVKEYVIASVLDMGTWNESILNLKEIVGRDGIPILFVYEGDEQKEELREIAEREEAKLIKIPRVNDPDLAVILALIPAQLLAFYLAKAIDDLSLEIAKFSKDIYWAFVNWDSGKGSLDQLKETVKSARDKYVSLLREGKLGLIQDPVKMDINRRFKRLVDGIENQEGSHFVRLAVRDLLKELKDDDLSTILFFEDLIEAREKTFSAEDPRGKIKIGSLDEIENIRKTVISGGYDSDKFLTLVDKWRAFLSENKITGGDEELIKQYQKSHATRGLAQKLVRRIDLPRGLAKEVTVLDGGRKTHNFFTEFQGLTSAIETYPVSAHVTPFGTAPVLDTKPQPERFAAAETHLVSVPDGGVQRIPPLTHVPGIGEWLHVNMYRSVEELPVEMQEEVRPAWTDHTELYEIKNDRLGYTAYIGIHKYLPHPPVLRLRLAHGYWEAHRNDTPWERFAWTWRKLWHGYWTLGGTRVKPFASDAEAINEVRGLDQAMTRKSVMSGMYLGGGKITVRVPFDPTLELNKARKQEIQKDLARVLEPLQVIITAVDANTTDEDIIFVMAPEAPHAIIGTNDPKIAYGGAIPSPRTARGVVLGMHAAAEIVFPEAPTLEGKRVALQGIGSVGWPLLRMLLQEEKVKKVYVAETVPSKIEEAKKEYQEEIAAGRLEILENPKAIYDVEADIFSPSSPVAHVLNSNTIPRLKVKIVAGANNIQLESPEAGIALHERGILYVPDYVINSGGLRAVETHLAGFDPDENIKGIYHAVKEVLERAIQENVPTSVMADRIADEKIAALQSQIVRDDTPEAIQEAELLERTQGNPSDEDLVNLIAQNPDYWIKKEIPRRTQLMEAWELLGPTLFGEVFEQYQTLNQKYVDVASRYTAEGSTRSRIVVGVENIETQVKSAIGEEAFNVIIQTADPVRLSNQIDKKTQNVRLREIARIWGRELLLKAQRGLDDRILPMPSDQDLYLKSIEEMTDYLSSIVGDMKAVIVSSSWLLAPHLGTESLSRLLTNTDGRLFFTRPTEEVVARLAIRYGELLRELQGRFVSGNLKPLSSLDSVVLLLDANDQKAFGLKENQFLSLTQIGDVKNAFVVPLNIEEPDLLKAVYLGLNLAEQFASIKVDQLESLDTATKLLVAEVAKGITKAENLIADATVQREILAGERIAVDVLKGM